MIFNQKIYDLEQCPFCGSNDVTIEDGGDNNNFFIQCQDCEASTGYFSNAEEAVDAWNNRV